MPAEIERDTRGKTRVGSQEETEPTPDRNRPGPLGGKEDPNRPGVLAETEPRIKRGTQGVSQGETDPPLGMGRGGGPGAARTRPGAPPAETEEKHKSGDLTCL